MAFNHEYPYTDPNRINTDWEINKVKEVLEMVDHFDAVAAEMEAALNKIDSMDNRIRALEALRDEVRNLSREVTNLDNSVSVLSNKVDLMNTALESMRALISTSINAEALKRIEGDTNLLQRINLINIQLTARIDELEIAISRLVPVDVWNRISGKRLPFDENNYRIYEDLRYLGFTNAELSSFGGSNEEVSNRVHDNRDFALNAKKRFKRFYVYTPDGVRKNLNNALSDIIVLIRGGLDNSAFDAYMSSNNLTNEDLSAVISTNFDRFSIQP